MVTEAITIFHLNTKSKKVFKSRLERLNNLKPIKLDRKIVSEIETKLVQYSPESHILAETLNYSAKRNGKDNNKSMRSFREW